MIDTSSKSVNSSSTDIADFLAWLFADTAPLPPLPPIPRSLRCACGSSNLNSRWHPNGDGPPKIRIGCDDCNDRYVKWQGEMKPVAWNAYREANSHVFSDQQNRA